MEIQRKTQDFDSGMGKGVEGTLSPGINLAERYLIQTVIGLGGMGSVYRARDMHFPNVVKLVAVKEMINQATDPMVRNLIVRNFEREANLLATLEHRAIPRIYDYFTINERSYLVLEFIDGKDLEALIVSSDEFLNQDRVIGWALELCDVLEYLHGHVPEPIVFRDMKPSNVMVNSNDHIVLIDFGIAKHFQSGEKGTMIGTEGYSPPEQYRGEASPLADVYSLGATLHHALTRRDPRLEPPFSFHERPIREINPQVSLELEQVIEKALQYEPAQRFASATVMKEALIGAARETGILPQISRSIPAKTPGLEGIKPVWTFACEDELRGSPNVDADVLYVGSYDNNLYALNAENGAFIWKYPTDRGIVSKPVVFENNIYFGSEDTRLHVVQIRSGRVNWTYYTEAPIRSSPWIAEGHVFVGSDDGYLHAVKTLSGRRAWKFEAGAPIRSTPLVQGEKVYFGSEAGDFFCLNLGGEAKWQFKAKRAITSSPIVAKDMIYFGSVDSYVYSLECNSGWINWRARLGKATISTPCILENVLFTGSIDGMIYAIDIATAKEIWHFATQNQVTGSPIVYQGALYCGSVDGYLYSLDAKTGRLRWKFKTDGPITSTPVINEDLVYIGSTDHRIYALMT